MFKIGLLLFQCIDFDVGSISLEHCTDVRLLYFRVDTVCQQILVYYDMELMVLGYYSDVGVNLL